MRLLALLLLSCIILSEEESISSKEASNYAFGLSGELYLATSYSHLAVPLSLVTLKRKIDLLEDAVNHLINARKHHSETEFQSATLKAQVYLIVYIK